MPPASNLHSRTCSRAAVAVVKCGSELVFSNMKWQMWRSIRFPRSHDARCSAVRTERSRVRLTWRGSFIKNLILLYAVSVVGVENIIFCFPLLSFGMSEPHTCTWWKRTIRAPEFRLACRPPPQEAFWWRQWRQWWRRVCVGPAVAVSRRSHIALVGV